LTSTDWIRVGKGILDRGDYSGTGGARMLLRHPDTEVAVLETARGGLLRRGLGVDRAAAALITNVAADHLGEYGINTLAELIETKFIVRRALGDGAPLILNADDAGIVAFAATLAGSCVDWFSLDADNHTLAAHRAAGGRTAFLREGWLVLAEGDDERRVIASEAIPATLGGAARHNVQNALGAMLLCQALGVAGEPIAAGLAGFRGDAQDNPGRANWFEAGGVKIVVDFAHNEHGMRALAAMVSRVPAQRRVLLMSQAGDRTDGDIRELVNTALEMQPERLLTCDLPGYERGRAAGDIPTLIRGFALAAGMDEGAIDICADPVSAVRAALDNARPGDLLVLLALSQREEVLAQLAAFIDRRTVPKTPTA
jgi:UDP-N-acetylmuramyl tripeptide synthase